MKYKGIFIILIIIQFISLVSAQINHTNINHTIKMTYSIETGFLSQEERNQFSKEISDMEIKNNKNSFDFLRYIFGEPFSLSYNFIFCFLIWTLLLLTLLLIQKRFNYSNKIKLLTALVLTILIANLKFNSYLSDLILFYVNTDLSKIFMIVLILFTITLELFFNYRKSKGSLQTYN